MSLLQKFGVKTTKIGNMWSGMERNRLSLMEEFNNTSEIPQ